MQNVLTGKQKDMIGWKMNGRGWKGKQESLIRDHRISITVRIVQCFPIKGRKGEVVELAVKVEEKMMEVK